MPDERVICVNLSVADLAAVDKMIDLAVLAGGKEYREPADLDTMYYTMYYRAFQDLDGHIWEALTLEERPTPGETQKGGC